MEGAWENTIKAESNKEMIFLEINAEKTAKHKFLCGRVGNKSFKEEYK